MHNAYTAISYLTHNESFIDLFDEDGFYKTGDLGYFDEENEVFYIERMKALIKYKLCHLPCYFLTNNNGEKIIFL